jgi:chemotaxis-related protein WspD
MIMDEIEKIEKCWKIIGVYGDGSCEKINSYIHCRHCPIFAKAGRSLLDREITEKAIKEWTEIYSTPKKQEATDSLSVVVFRIHNEYFALKTKYFQETIELKAIHTVPFRTNNVFLGIVNVGGELLLAISAKNLFDLSETLYEIPQIASFKRMVVVIFNGHRCVLPVDEVIGVTQISESIIQKAPITLAKSPTSFSSGIFNLNNKNIGLIDETKFFSALDKNLSW